MEQLVEQGLCKAIGISNFTVKKTKTLLEIAKILPACNQGIHDNFHLFKLEIIIILKGTILSVTMYFKKPKDIFILVETQK